MILAIDIESHKSLKELVYEELKEHIITGILAPGTRIREETVAKMFRTSRTPIREALRKLEHEGLVTILPKRGAFVLKMSLKDVRDVLEVRETFEGFAAYLYAAKAEIKDITKLKSATDNYGRAVAENNLKDMLKYDTEFHQIIIAACGNNMLIRMMEQLYEVILRYRYVYYGEFRTLEKMNEEHKMILQAIESGDSDEAKKCMETHINNVKNYIISIGS